MGAPIGVVEIHLQLEITAHVEVPTPSPFAPPLFLAQYFQGIDILNTIIQIIIMYEIALLAAVIHRFAIQYQGKLDYDLDSSLELRETPNVY